MERALKHGLYREDTSGSLRRYLDKLYWSHRKCFGVIVVHNYTVFVLDGTTVITAFELPHKYKHNFDMIMSKRKKADDDSSATDSKTD